MLGIASERQRKHSHSTVDMARFLQSAIYDRLCHDAGSWSKRRFYDVQLCGHGIRKIWFNAVTGHFVNYRCRHSSARFLCVNAVDRSRWQKSNYQNISILLKYFHFLMLKNDFHSNASSCWLSHLPELASAIRCWLLIFFSLQAPASISMHSNGFQWLVFRQWYSLHHAELFRFRTSLLPKFCRTKWVLTLNASIFFWRFRFFCSS